MGMTAAEAATPASGAGAAVVGGVDSSSITLRIPVTATLTSLILPVPGLVRLAPPVALTNPHAVPPALVLALISADPSFPFGTVTGPVLQLRLVRRDPRSAFDIINSLVCHVRDIKLDAIRTTLHVNASDVTCSTGRGLSRKVR